jgi:membrane dipeptidase
MPAVRPIIDAHLDLAWNAVSYDRDQLLPVADLRAADSKLEGKGRGACTVSLHEMRGSGIGLCLATVLARALPKDADKTLNMGKRGQRTVLLREDLDYANQTIACCAARCQLAYYELLEQQGHMAFIRNRGDLERLWAPWSQGPSDRAPIGFILSMEGADPIIEPKDAAWWWEQGLRTACLAHYGPSAYAMGTGGDGPLTARGRDLVKIFDELGMILDLVHTADTAFDQALEIYGGPAFVSHGNCRALAQHDRQLTDRQIRAIVERGGVIGAVLDCWMMMVDYNEPHCSRQDVTLDKLVDHIDHVCQVAGSAAHAGIGSDLDGGFGTEQCPADLDTIHDLHKLEPLLARRGYSDQDIDAIFYGNWLRFFGEALPER